MSNFILTLINMSLAAGWVIGLVLILRLVLKRAPRWIICLLWGLAALRLICPFAPESPVSLLPSAQTVQVEQAVPAAPADHAEQDGQPIPGPEVSDPSAGAEQDPVIQSVTVNTGIEPLDEALNPVAAHSSEMQGEAGQDRITLVLQIAFIIWAAGAASILLAGTVSYIRLRRRVRFAVRSEDGVYRCDAITTPFILGTLSPRIYLPYDMSEEAAGYVLAHERAHLKRLDHIWKAVGYLLLAAYWFHPLVWAAYLFFCRDMETACDEKVVAGYNRQQQADYAETLLNCSMPSKMMLTCPLAFGEVNVVRRIKKVLSYRRTGACAAALILISCLLLTGCFLVNPEKKPEKAESSSALLPPETSAESETPSLPAETASETVSESAVSGPEKSPVSKPAEKPASTSDGGVLTRQFGNVKVIYTKQIYDNGGSGTVMTADPLYIRDGVLHVTHTLKACANRKNNPFSGDMVCFDGQNNVVGCLTADPCYVKNPSTIGLSAETKFEFDRRTRTIWLVDGRNRITPPLGKTFKTPYPVFCNRFVYDE